MYKSNWLFITALSLSLVGGAAQAETKEVVVHDRLMDHGDGHLMDMDGAMVMGQNKDKLPGGCNKISEDKEITVHAGRKYSKEHPGTIFGFNKHEWNVKPCTRLTVNFINEDNIRHQWMMHGLPKYLYDKGMFHLEVTGPGKVTGTLILPGEDKTYLVHCDMAQHMEKGMKGQLIAGKGSTPFPSIPGITPLAIPDDYNTPLANIQPVTTSANMVPPGAKAGKTDTLNTPVSKQAATAQQPEPSDSVWSGSFVLGLLLGSVGIPWSWRKMQEKNMTVTGLFNNSFIMLRNTVDSLLGLISRLSGKS